MMNRRNFLKRTAAVAAGAVAVPTVASTFTTKDVMDAAQVPWGEFHGEHNRYTWTQVYGPYCPGEVNAASEDFLNTASDTPLHELGAIAITGDGRHYKYMKNCTAEQLIARTLC